MELSQDILKGLHELGDSKQFGDAAFKELIEFAFRVVLNKISEEKITASANLSKMDQILVKQTFGSLVSFILEGAKLNSDPLQMKGVLEEQEIPEPRSDMITKYYSEAITPIRRELSTTGFSFPHLVDIKWRLDYFMRSNTLEKVNAPVYLLSLNTKKSREVSQSENEESGNTTSTDDKVEFTCTMEQLQDLLTKLKDAAKQVERSSNNNM